MSNKIKPSDVVYTHGEHDWSVVWSKDTGEVLKYGDRDVVYDWLLDALMIEELELRDDEWYDASARRPMPLPDVIAAATANLLTRAAVEALRQQAYDLRSEAHKLDEQADAMEV